MSSDPLAKYVPLDDHAAHVTTLLCFDSVPASPDSCTDRVPDDSLDDDSVASSAKIDVDQSRTNLSPPQVATNDPSGDRSRL